MLMCRRLIPRGFVVVGFVDVCVCFVDSIWLALVRWFELLDACCLVVYLFHGFFGRNFDLLGFLFVYAYEFVVLFVFVFGLLVLRFVAFLLDAWVFRLGEFWDLLGVCLLL